MASSRSKLDEIVAAFDTLEDPRSEINRRHPLPSILVIAVLAVLAGAAGPTAIARWAKFKEEMLTELLDLPRGVPRKDVFRRVLMTLKPDAFEEAFNAWIARLRDEATATTGVDRPIVAIDGKTARRSHDAARDLGALHVVTAWAGEYGLALGQELYAEKSNEITAIPELLKKIDVRGGIVTIDAMGTQKAIAEQIVRGRADYVLAAEAEPRDPASRGRRVHRPAVGRRVGNGPGVDDDRAWSWASGGADVSATDGAQGIAGSDRVEGPEVGGPGDVAVRAGWAGACGIPVLPEQPVGGRGTGCAGGAWPLVGGERVPLEPRRDVPGRRVAGARAGPGVEHHVAVSVHTVDPQAAPGPASEPDHEATGLRVERQVPDGSHRRINMLVCAGPGRTSSLGLIANR